MSELTIRGTVTKILEPINGVSKAGKEWNKQDFLITTDDKYPKDVCFTLFGDKTDLISSISVSDEVDVSFNIESREWGGKYFSNINAWKVLLVNPKQSKQPIESTKPLPPEFNNEPMDVQDEDLPF